MPHADHAVAIASRGVQRVQVRDHHAPVLFVDVPQRLHHQLRGLISTSRRGAGEDADLDFEQIEEQLELAELDAEEAAYSKEEAGALLNIY